jgi:hypothetical protein
MEPSEVPPLPIDPKPFVKPDPTTVVKPSGGPGPLLEGGGGLVDGPTVKPATKERKQ